MAVPDIPSYLQFAYGDTGEAVPSPAAYHPGFGLLLRPLVLIGIVGHDLHQAALVLNSILAGVCVYLAAIFGSRLGLSRRAVTACALLGALYPSVSAASRIAWPETLLCVTVLGLAVLAHGQTPLQNLSLGLLSGLIFAVHPRAVVATFAVVSLALVTSSKYLRRPLLVGLIVGWMLSGALIFWTDTWQESRVESAQETIALFDVIVSGLGQITAIANSSIGLGLLGALMSLATTSHVMRRKAPLNSNAATRVYLGAGFLAMTILGGIALAGSERLDTAIYGRYLDPWVLPLVIVAIAQLKTRPTRSQLRQLTLTFAVGVIVLAFASTDLVEPPRRIMTLSSGWMWEITNQVPIFLAMTVAVGALVVVVNQVFPDKMAHVLVGVLLLTSAGSTAVNHAHLSAVGDIAEGQASTVIFLPETLSCLAHDVASTKPYTPSLYQMSLPNVEHRIVDLAAGRRPCSAYLIAGLEIADKCPNASLIAKELRGQWGLWHNPTEVCG